MRNKESSLISEQLKAAGLYVHLVQGMSCVCSAELKT